MRIQASNQIKLTIILLLLLITVSASTQSDARIRLPHSTVIRQFLPCGSRDMAIYVSRHTIYTQGQNTITDEHSIVWLHFSGRKWSARLVGKWPGYVYRHAKGPTDIVVMAANSNQRRAELACTTTITSNKRQMEQLAWLVHSDVQPRLVVQMPFTPPVTALVAFNPANELVVQCGQSLFDCNHTGERNLIGVLPSETSLDYVFPQDTLLVHTLDSAWQPVYSLLHLKDNRTKPLGIMSFGHGPNVSEVPVLYKNATETGVANVGLLDANGDIRHVITLHKTVESPFQSPEGKRIALVETTEGKSSGTLEIVDVGLKVLDAIRDEHGHPIEGTCPLWLDNRRIAYVAPAPATSWYRQISTKPYSYWSSTIKEKISDAVYIVDIVTHKSSVVWSAAQ